MHFIACQGFAGAFDLGAVQAGFEMAGKVEDTGGFGMAMCEANRHILGDRWPAQISVPEKWEVPRRGVELLLGNPPCSLAGSA